MSDEEIRFGFNEDDEEPQRGFTGYFIPVEIVDDTALRATDKLLLAEIVALSKNADNACWASNEHLARQVGMSAGGISNALSRLRRCGYIEDVRFDGRRRWIRVIIKQLDQHYSNGEGRVHHLIKKDIRRDTRREKEKILKEKCEKIYACYPRKVAKPPALLAIARAIKREGFEKILGATKAFAAARPDKNDQFTPHPATWFNAERYNDDPATWRLVRGGAKAAAKTPRELERERIAEREHAAGEEELRNSAWWQEEQRKKKQKEKS